MLKSFTNLLPVLVLVSTVDSVLLAQNNFWQPAGLDSLAVRALAINFAGNIFAGTDSGLFRSTNDGNSWIRTSLNPYCYDLVICPSGEIYAASGTGSPSSLGRIYRSTDNGMTWPVAMDSAWLPLQLAANASNHIFVGKIGSRGDALGIFRSVDHGQSWANIAVDAAVSGIGINSDGVILVAGGLSATDLGILRSTDNGNSWQQLLRVSSMGFPSAFAFSGVNNVFWGCCSRSTDNGGTWTPITGNPTRAASLAVNSLGHIFASQPGVSRSTNNGISWESLNTGLTNLNVGRLAINSKGYIFAGTEAGVFRSVNPTTSIKEISANLPKQSIMCQNYPNPFNPTTVIRYSLPARAQVTLTIYNMLGQEVTSLINQDQSAGTYEVTWDASRFSSGVYFYRLQAGQFTQTKKLLLMR